MNNDQIIEEALLEQGLFTIEQLDMMREMGYKIPYHTKRYWLNHGYKVNDNVDPLIVHLWRKNKEGLWYKKKSFLYSIEQVSLI